MIILPMQMKHDVDSTIAHELTHHALSELNLPAWMEEGFTQMMEERVTSVYNFTVNHELLQRHRLLWSTIGLRSFWEGESFHSARDDEQELSYHLSQLIVRSMLSDRPEEFLAFARSCRTAESVEAAALETLGLNLDSLASHVLGAGDWRGSN